MVGLVVVGLVVAGLGVASATVWRPSDTAVMTTGEQSGATLLTTAPGVLSLVDRDVTITARSSDDAQVVLALGSQVDVEGWVGEDPALRVTGASDWETLTVSKVSSAGSDTRDATDAATDASADPSAEATAETDAAAPAAPGPDPSGSDMWVESTSGTGTATLDWDATSTDQVLLVAAVGEDAAAPQLTLSWPREVTTPLLWPGVALGVLLVVLGLIYGIVTRGRRRRRPVVVPAARADDAAAPTPAGGTPATGALTRRQLRELAEQQEAETEAAAAAAPRQKRQWPWTGAIPVVKPAEPEDSDEADKKPASPEAHRAAWLPEGTGSTSGSSWRAAWGVRTPETGTAGTTPDDAAPGSAAVGGPSAPGAAAAGTAPAGRASGAAGATDASTPSTAAPEAPTAPASSTAGPGPATTASVASGAASAPTTRPAPTAPSAPTTPSGQRPAPQSSKPTSSTTSARPPAARPVDPGSPFQRITLRSSDESAPARRIRRDQQQAPSAWSASRSPWAQPARPGTDPAGTPRPAPGAGGTPSTGSGRTDGTTEPTDDTSKDSD
ncbi:hypothetical protein SANBI_001019 [Sanguibacter sp. 4.1]|uniref:Uncharacterized protein n=1 Tax=Sanguibacter biliveldensis TaxID=3030830 RepID=A0AAF0Z5U5_9MICO|nr:hypothetical protein [Sanguibacter sp. 4.1]WPF83352.1 hypothetical protein SANBI_001019 [Sanguibacter sp. 4.1]